MDVSKHLPAHIASGSTATPRQDGFYLPADDARLGRVWLPWPGNAQANLRGGVANLARIITDLAPVTVIAAPGDELEARKLCGRAAEIETLAHTTARLRDAGPAFLVDGKGGSAAVDWKFNGWGGRVSSDKSDIDLAHALLGLAEVRRFRAPLTLENSAFTGDGHDTVIALAPAVFDEKRNPQVTRMEAFAIFMYWLGAARVIWLEDAHPADALMCDVRALAAFISPGTVAVSAAHPDNVHGETLQRIAQRLERATDAHGNTLHLVRLPAPPPLENPDSAPLSYTAFVPINGAVLVPAFDAPADERAADILAGAFEKRQIISVPARELAEAGISLTSLILPHQARMLERDRASVLPRSAWSHAPPDVDALLQKYIDMAEADR